MPLRTQSPAWQYLAESFKLMGPAFLVSVSHVDPGDWATAIEAGSRFGDKLVWVVVLSHLIAIHLQNLSARLGLVTGRHLAQVCRQHYPRLVCYLLWIMCEVSIVALDLTMVLGTALGLSLLLRVPVLPCILVSGLDTLLLVVLPQLGMRKAERLTVGLMAAIVLCFVVELFIVKPPVQSVIDGLYPTLSRDSLYTAVSLLGANVMPHNFYLHSALVTSQAQQGRSTGVLCHYNFIDISVALGIALLVNVAVTVVAAETFFSRGIIVLTLQDAHDMMEQILSSSVAPAAFGLALLCAGQLSTFTGTISGQVVLQGFLNIRMKTWLRRLVTRTAAVVPAALLQYLYGSEGTYKLLVMMQVVLALALPFTLVPLIKATSSEQLMGRFKNSPAVALLSWGACSLIFCANLLLLLHWLFPGGEEEDDFLDVAVSTAFTKPLLFAAIVGLVVIVSAALALLVWMISTSFGGEFHSTLLPEKGAGAFLAPSQEVDIEKAVGGDAIHGDARLRGTAIVLPDAFEQEAEKPPRAEEGTQAVVELAPLMQSMQEEISAPEQAQVLEREASASSDADWESRADDLLQRDVLDIRKDLQRPAVASALPGTALPEPQTGTAWEASTAGDGQDSWEIFRDIGAPHRDASTSDSQGRLQMAQGSRREVATLMGTFWTRLYDLHGQALGSHVLAQALSRPGPKRSSAVSRDAQDIVDMAIDTLARLHALDGGESLLNAQHSGGSEIGRHERTILDILRAHPDASLHLKPRESSRAPGLCLPERAAPVTRSGGREGLPACEADACIELLTFGVWCIVRLLELCRQEPRPELWGKNAAVLNRLQGILRHAGLVANTARGQAADLAAEILQLVRDAESAISARRGQAGTGAGDVAFPKGKEIIFTVLKRYRRLLTTGEAPVQDNPAKRARMSVPAGQFLAALGLLGCMFLLAGGSGVGWRDSLVSAAV